MILLLNKDYNYEVSFINSPNIEDKILLNSWKAPNPTESLFINQQDLLGENIRYIHAVGHFEVGKGEVKSYVDGQLLPKEARVTKHSSNVIFFEYEQRVYAIVEICASKSPRIRSSLFGQRIGQKMEEWGEIEWKLPFPFTFDNKFFYWLLSKKGHAFEIRDKRIEVIDVSAISLTSDRNVYESNSFGPDLLNGSLAALSGLSSNETVHQAGIKLKIDSTTFNIEVSKEGVTVIDKYHCYKEGASFVSFDSDCCYFLLLLYETIYPELLLQFNIEKSSGNWNQPQELSQRKAWAIKVIRNLIEQNDIELEDIMCGENVEKEAI